MGQKSNPIGLRLQINRTWDSRWYAEGRDYAQLLKEDVAIRKYIMKNLPQGVSNAPFGQDEWQQEMVANFAKALVASPLTTP